MNISKTSQTLSQIASPKKTVSIKRLFQKTFAYSADTYQRLSNCDTQVIGQLPSDILKMILNSGGDKKTKIKRVQGGFQKVAQFLETINQIEIDAAEKSTQNLSQLIRFKNKFSSIRDLVLSKVRSRNKINAQLSLAESSFKVATEDIFPKGTKIKITHIGSGCWGNVYKISCKKGCKNVCNPLVIKNFNSLEQATKREVLQRKKLFPAIFCRNPKGVGEIAGSFIDSIKRYHGPYSEANNVQYIRTNTGHKFTDKDNLLLPDMFVLSSSPFSVARFSNFRHKPTRFLNFRKLGICPEDVYNNPNNIVRNRVIDFGGMTHHTFLNGGIEDKTVMKYFKKITSKPYNQAQELMERYKKVAESTQDLTLKEKISTAVGVAKDYISIYGL